jgi:hypothetical protein
LAHLAHLCCFARQCTTLYKWICCFSGHYTILHKWVCCLAGHYAAFHKWMRYCGGGRNVTWQSRKSSVGWYRNIPRKLRFIATDSSGRLLRYGIRQYVVPCRYLKSERVLMSYHYTNRNLNIDTNAHCKWLNTVFFKLSRFAYWQCLRVIFRRCLVQSPTSWLRSFMVFSVPPSKYLDIISGQDCFFPSSYQFISRHSVLCSVATWVALNQLWSPCNQAPRWYNVHSMICEILVAEVPAHYGKEVRIQECRNVFLFTGRRVQ